MHNRKMRTRSPSSIQLLTIVLMLPWLNLCVKNVGKVSVISVHKYKLPISQRRRYWAIEASTSLTDLVVISNNLNSEFFVLPANGGDPLKIPVDIVPSELPHDIRIADKSYLSKDFIELGNVRCTSFQESFIYHHYNGSSIKFTVICQVQDRPEMAFAIQRSLFSNRMLLNTPFLLKKVDEKLVAFISSTPREKQNREETIIELPFPTASQIEAWGGNSDFKKEFLDKFAENPEPLMIKFKNKEEFVKFETRGKNINTIYSSTKNNSNLFFVQTKGHVDAFGFGDVCYARGVTHNGKLVFQEESISKENLNYDVNDIYKQEYINGTMGIASLYTIGSSVEGLISDQKQFKLEMVQENQEKFFEDTEFKIKFLSEIDQEKYKYTSFETSAVLVAVKRIKLVVLAQKRSDESLEIFSIVYSFENDPREEFIIKNKFSRVKNARTRIINDY